MSATIDRSSQVLYASAHAVLGRLVGLQRWSIDLPGTFDDLGACRGHHEQLGILVDPDFRALLPLCPEYRPIAEEAVSAQVVSAMAGFAATARVIRSQEGFEGWESACDVFRFDPYIRPIVHDFGSYLLPPPVTDDPKLLADGSWDDFWNWRNLATLIRHDREELNAYLHRAWLWTNRLIDDRSTWAAIVDLAEAIDVHREFEAFEIDAVLDAIWPRPGRSNALDMPGRVEAR